MRSLLLIAPLLLTGCAAKVAENANPLASGLPAKPAEPPKPVDISALENDAYAYYGLANRQVIDMRVTSSTTSSVQTGSQTVSLQSATPKEALFKIERSGGLENLGNNVMRLTPEGLFVHSSDKMKVGPNDLELPARIVVGKTWKVRSEMIDKSMMSLDTVNRIEGFRPVTTKRTTYKDALLVTTRGEGTMSGKKVVLTAKQYFVKGRGPVKQEFRSVQADGKVVAYTLQEDK